MDWANEDRVSLQPKIEALKAVAQGVASAEQQKAALVLIHHVARTFEEVTGSDGVELSRAAGRQAVGLAIRRMIAVDIGRLGLGERR